MLASQPDIQMIGGGRFGWSSAVADEADEVSLDPMKSNRVDRVEEAAAVSGHPMGFVPLYISQSEDSCSDIDMKGAGSLIKYTDNIQRSALLPSILLLFVYIQAASIADFEISPQKPARSISSSLISSTCSRSTL
jgi:hypothetical protein